VIVDTSALSAILLREPEEEQFLDLLLGADRVRIGAPTLVEAGLIASERGLSKELDDLLDLIAAEVVVFDAHMAGIAVDAFIRFGKGRHPARLNYGDCFSYATAKAFNEPLLFKGTDFAKTDVTPVETSA
jgi:ribonuclease VapC